MKRQTPIILPLVMLAFFAAMSAMALTFPPQARLVPVLVGGSGMFLSLLQLVSSMRSSDASHRVGVFSRSDVILLSWVAFFMLAILALGFPIGSAVSLGLYLRIRNDVRWTSTLIAAFACWVLFSVVFSWLLRMPLHEGFVFRLILF